MSTRAVTAMGEWVGDMRPWDAFGGLTYDPKRLGHVKLLKPQHNTGDWNRRGASRFSWRDQERKSDGSVVRGSGLVHRESVEADVKQWVRDSAALIGRRIEYVIALERQHFTGQWHAHPLLDCGGVDDLEREAMGRMWFDRHGLSKLEYPRDSGDAAAYAAKYLAKDMERGDILLSPRLKQQLEGRVKRLAGIAVGRAM
jgi:hypothetical protein